MKKPFLILQLRPEDETSDNEYEAFCTVGNLAPADTHRIRVEQSGLPELDLDRYAGVIVGGSPFDVSTPEADKGVLQQRIERDFRALLTSVIAQDKPFLGVCSGVGLLSMCCGGVTTTRYGEAVGGVDVVITEKGTEDPLLIGLPSPFRALVGHKEACEILPKNTVLLARSASCPVQMFRVGTNVYATQFHPEADAAVFQLRINVYKHHGYFPPETATKLSQTVEAEQTPIPKEILKRFVARYHTDIQK